jgi:hypothetical protein
LNADQPEKTRNPSKNVILALLSPSPLSDKLHSQNSLACVVVPCLSLVMSGFIYEESVDH